MSLDLGGVTSHLVGAALDAAVLRHDVIANNIANYDTPNYKAKRLHFETVLSDMLLQLNNGNESAVKARIEAFRTSLQEAEQFTVTENEVVELDKEMVRLAENTLRYQALLKAASKQGAVLSMAINGGRQ